MTLYCFYSILTTFTAKNNKNTLYSWVKSCSKITFPMYKCKHKGDGEIFLIQSNFKVFPLIHQFQQGPITQQGECSPLGFRFLSILFFLPPPPPQTQNILKSLIILIWYSIFTLFIVTYSNLTSHTGRCLGVTFMTSQVLWVLC